MSEREDKKQHEIWFKNEYPDDYLLFIHDASKEALVKFINSEKSWQASANRQGYKLVPVDTLEECLNWASIAEWDSTSKETDSEINHHKQIIKAMIGVVE